MLDAKLAPSENLNYPLGTDIMGRDMLSRLIYGARTSVLISLVALARGPWWARYWAWSLAIVEDGSMP
jgi:ABC-type dipeptide/oligopeptide/nickel transport system permease subunit